MLIPFVSTQFSLSPMKPVKLISPDFQHSSHFSEPEHQQGLDGLPTRTRGSDGKEDVNWLLTSSPNEADWPGDWESLQDGRRLESGSLSPSRSPQLPDFPRMFPVLALQVLYPGPP